MFSAGGKTSYFSVFSGDNSRYGTVAVLRLPEEILAHKIPKALIFLLAVREEHEVSYSFGLLSSSWLLCQEG